MEKKHCSSLYVEDQMTQGTDLQSRLAFNLLDDATSALLRAHKDLLMAELPAVLDQFYDHVSRFGDAAAMFRSRQHMAHAKEMQLRHWAIIVEGRFDQSYQTSVQKIGETHNKLGLEPRWYIGGYSFLVTKLTEVVNTRLSASFLDTNKAKRVQLQNAIIRAAMLDMDIAISVYIDAGRRDRRQTLDRLADNFSSAFGNVFGILSQAAVDLKKSAEFLTSTAAASTEQSSSVAAAAEQASANV